MALVAAWRLGSQVGGIENHVRFMTRELGRLGHECVLFVPEFDDVWSPGRSVVGGITVEHVRIGRPPIRIRPGNRRAGRLGYVAAFANKLAYTVGHTRLERAIRSWDPDIVWQHDFTSSWLATRVLSRAYPVVLTNHTGEYLEFAGRPVLRTLLPRMLRHYAAIVGPSWELTPSLPNAYHIPNGVDTDAFDVPDADERQSLRRELFGDRADRFIVLCPRRWAPTKGVVHLARAIEQLAGSGRFLFAFAGDDHPDYPAYRAEVAHILEPYEDSIVRLGSIDVFDLARHYQAADLTVIPSLLEAISLAALESMACGTPVLATAVGGMPDLIDDGLTGYLVPPADADALAKAIRRAAAEAGELESMARRGRQLVEREYQWSAIAERTLAILAQASAGGVGTRVTGVRATAR